MGKNTPTERAVSAACAIHHANCAAHGLTPDPDSGAVPYLAEIIDRCAGIPSLLAEVERLRAENARLREALRKLEGEMELISEEECECDNTHTQNQTVCRYCWCRDHAREALAEGERDGR